MPFYVSPEQAMKDKADYARKGIARGRSVVILQYVDGVVFVADNPSRTLHKISEIYDRIAFAAAGKYNEFENLRLAGLRFADTHGYVYDRRDVTGRSLANAYAQTLGTIFTETPKPYEVEIVVAEVGDAAGADQIYRLTFDGSVADEQGFLAMGGTAEQVATALKERYEDDMELSRALGAAVEALAQQNGERRELSASQLEVAVLDRNRAHRKFRRVQGRRLETLLEQGRPSSEKDSAPAEGGEGSSSQSSQSGQEARATGTAKGGSSRAGDGDTSPGEDERSGGASGEDESDGESGTSPAT